MHPTGIAVALLVAMIVLPLIWPAHRRSGLDLWRRYRLPR